MPPRAPRHTSHRSRLAWRNVPRLTTSMPRLDRRDIQGIRALAVVAVISQHLLDWPKGGFVGVDIFFVISGFLITELLLRQQESSGQISLTAFYRRRVKRIMPTSLLVLGVTVVGSYFVFNSVRLHAVLLDSVWALCFAGNWRFASLSTDYFNADGPVSPLQHYWSLGVEEQFYFVWPWLMLLAFGLPSRFGRRADVARLTVGALISVVTVASFIWAAWETREVPNRAYFSTLSRSWELGVGALLAVMAPLLKALPSQARPVMAWTGFIAMITSMCVIDSTSSFPTPTAAFPVLGAALVIAAGTGTVQQVKLAPLTNPFSSYVGDLSYSLYLWHLPVIILGTSLWGSATPTLAALGTTLVIVSMYSYHLFENPIRRSAWLDPQPRGAQGHWGQLRKRLKVSRQYQLTALSGLAVVTLVINAFALHTPDPPRSYRMSSISQVDAGVPTATTALTPRETELKHKIAKALDASAWPDLRPSLETVIAGPAAPPEIGACGWTNRLVREGTCTWGDPKGAHRAVTIGDSISATYAGVLGTALTNATGWKVSSYSTFGCPFTSVRVRITASSADCARRNASAVAAINRLRPEVVFLSQVPRPKADGKEMSAQEWRDGVAKQWAKVQVKAKLVILEPPPRDVDISQCYTRRSVPADCVSTITNEWLDRSKSDQTFAANLGGVFVNSAQWFCVNGACPPFVDSVPTKMDAYHMSPAYAKRIAPAVLERLRKLGLLRSP